MTRIKFVLANNFVGLEAKINEELGELENGIDEDQVLTILSVEVIPIKESSVTTGDRIVLAGKILFSVYNPGANANYDQEHDGSLGEGEYE